jgi:hypothetical protein
MTGTTLDFNKYCEIPFGADAEVHEERNITNTMDARTQPDICLGPTANFQGSYKFLLLQTGKRITRKQFKELPMPSSIIKRVEAMAIKEKQDKTITFYDRSGTPITDLYDSHNENTNEAAAGVENGNKEAINEAPGIAIEEHSNDDDITVNDGTTGVHVPEVSTEDGGTTGVHAPGVTTEDGGATGVQNETIEDDGVTGVHSETIEDGGVT